jgi:phytanoyl-CoA hydroxylase
MGGYVSNFGGLWVDRRDPHGVAARLHGIADPARRAAMASFIQDGFAILPGAVDHDLIEAYLLEFRRAAALDRYLLMAGVDGGRQWYDSAKSLQPGARILDTGMLLPHGLDLMFAPRIHAFLTELFDQPPLAMQNLHFEVGSTQTVHRDTAFVVVAGAPLRLAASWIALEDIGPGTGELIYYPGGHRITEFLYKDAEGRAAKHWSGAGDRDTANAAHQKYLAQEAARLGLRLSSFRAKKGDALIWHADLPHGGGPISRPATRRSLVTHYCPLSDTPNYYHLLPDAWRRKTPTRAGAVCSMYYPPELFPV